MLEFKSLNEFGYTQDELQDIDQQSYNKAQQLIQKELESMEIDKTHPLVKKAYPSENTGFKDSSLLKRFQRDQRPLIDVIDNSRYKDFQITETLSPGEIKRIYTAVSYQKRLNK